MQQVAGVVQGDSHPVGNERAFGALLNQESKHPCDIPAAPSSTESKDDHPLQLFNEENLELHSNVIFAATQILFQLQF